MVSDGGFSAKGGGEPREGVGGEFGAPTWPNGFDIAPEWLRREIESAGELTLVAAE